MRGEEVMKKSIAMVITCIGLIGVLAGCGASSKEDVIPSNTSLVLGNHMYFPNISLNSSSIYNPVYETAYSWGNVSAVIVDGNPEVACNFEVKDPGKDINNAKRKQLAENNTNSILMSIANSKATEPEIDTLKAIVVSANALNSGNTSNIRTMIVVDSGLSTTGLLNFAEKNLFEASVDDVINQLKEKHALPNLEGVDVLWIGLGEVSGEQAPLTSSNRYQLEQLWTGILSASGAKSVVFDSSPLSGAYDDSLPECSIVPIVEDSLDVDPNSMPEIIKFDENTSVKFVGDKAEFIDVEAAKKDIAPIAEYLIAHPQETIYICGMTATVGSEPNTGKGLSLKRAESCKKVLIEMGVSESQLICVGLGQAANPLRVDDVDESGKQTANASKNRAVFFIQSDSLLLNELIS